ncbi:MAG: hypothetical protein GY861_18090 [bacterium]|nr:hypothetical protein [bacterium]
MEKQKHIAKNNPKDFLEVEVGDYKQPDFKPQVKIKRWDNEVNFSVRLKNYNKNKHDLEFVPTDDAFKFIWYLKEKPTSNIVEFTMQTKGVDFFYQPELTQEEIDEGCHRPDEVVGSYAVYCSEQKTNWKGGKEYKCGKVGHIYRPHLYDADGKEEWGILNIDEKKGTYTVEIPQDFLNNAVYPIKSNDTFGYSTNPGNTSTTSWARALVGGSTVYSASSGDEITSIHVYGKESGALGTSYIGVYDFSGGLPVNQIYGEESIIHSGGGYEGWAAKTGLSISLDAEDVTVAVRRGSVDNIFYDIGGASENSYYNGAMQDPWVSSGTSNAKYGVYATYTPSGGAATSIASVNGMAIADIASINGVAIADIDSVNGVSNTS